MKKTLLGFLMTFTLSVPAFAQTNQELNNLLMMK